MTTDDNRLLAEAQAAIEERYPGIKLESAVQGWAYLGKFERGIHTYRLLHEPEGKDDRWLGVCFFQRFEDMLAQEAFYRALAKGEEGARVNLAHLLRFLERSEEAESELVRVDTSKFTPYDEVLFLRVSSLHEENNGNIRKAVEFAESAWERVQGIPEFQILAPSVLGQLGILYGRMGEARRALRFLEQGIELTTGLEQQKVKLRRATLLISLGRTSDAERELRAMVGLPEALELEREFLFGDLLLCRGQLDAGMSKFQSALEKASRLAVGSDEFACRLTLAALMVHQKRFDEAQDHLGKGRILISDRTDILLYRFREILVHLHGKYYGLEDGASELEMLADEFKRLGVVQEEAFVRLHLADVYRQSNVVRAEDELRKINQLCASVHNHLFLNREWWLLPELKALAKVLQPSLFTESTNRLTVSTVGREEIYLNDEPVKLPMKRGVEVLAYFLEYRHVTLSALLRDLFPGQKTRTARSYFHQFRVQLRKAIPGLRVAFNPQQKRYELEYEVDLQWDVENLRTGSEMVRGHFLPSSEAEWVRRIDSEIQSLTQQLS